MELGGLEVVQWEFDSISFAVLLVIGGGEGTSLPTTVVEDKYQS